MPEYSIGCSTWGHIIVWQRERGSHSSWDGANTLVKDIDPTDIINYADYEFALWLQVRCKVGDWVYNSNLNQNLGWRKITRVLEWCVYTDESLPLIYIAAHADANKDTVTFRPGVQWQDRIKWKLYGF